jgi:Tfp pilus assembly protein PilX
MRTHNYSGDKGIAIFITLMLLFLLSLAAIAVLLTAYNYNNICEGQIRRLKAMTSAEAGVNYVYWKLGPKTDDITYAATHTDEINKETITIGGNSVNVWIEGPVSGKYTIKSKVIYQKSSAK